MLVWIQRMLTAATPPNMAFTSSLGPLCPSKRLVAQTALLHLLSTNVDLFGVFVDQCYAADPAVSEAFFQVSGALSYLLSPCASTPFHWVFQLSLVTDPETKLQSSCCCCISIWVTTYLLLPCALSCVDVATLRQVGDRCTGTGALAAVSVCGLLVTCCYRTHQAV